jgi:hypothetical protein
MLVAAAAGLRTGLGPFEVWTAPTAGVLITVGAFRLRRDPQPRSWPVLGPGLALLLVPTLLIATRGDDVPRVVVLVVAASAVVVGGACLRWQAPIVLGGVVLAAHATAQLGPWVVRTVAGQPRWVVLGVMGVLLLVLGATYERQQRRQRSLRLRLSALR